MNFHPNFTILGFIFPGVTQNPILTQDYICEEGVVRYTCVVNSTLLQWIVEPIINATEGQLFITSTSGSVLPFRDDGGNVVIDVERIEDDPLTTTLNIKSNLNGILDVECRDFLLNSSDSKQHSRSKYMCSVIILAC